MYLIFGWTTSPMRLKFWPETYLSQINLLWKFHPHWWIGSRTNEVQLLGLFSERTVTFDRTVGHHLLNEKYFYRRISKALVVRSRLAHVSASEVGILYEKKCPLAQSGIRVLFLCLSYEMVFLAHFCYKTDRCACF